MNTEAKAGSCGRSPNARNAASRFPSIRSVVSGVAVAAIVALAASGAALAQTGEGAPGIEARGVDKAVQDFLAANNLPGATVAVTRGGRLVWAKGYGKADLATDKAMQPWHRSYIGSVSKFLTGVGAMKLVEEGKLDLNAPLYGSGAALWGASLLDAPGLAVSGDGAVLQPASDYFKAIVQGVNSLDPNFPPSASASPNLLTATLYRTLMDRTLSWASAVRIKHLLTHTSGLLGEDNVPAAEAQFQKSEDALTYGEVHLNALTGGAGAPFLFEPETQRDYSNHAFALFGFLMGEVAGVSYRQFMEQRVLHPLGLIGVVPINTANSDLDATPYSKDGDVRPFDANDQSRLKTATGGWTATARDLVRLMCSLDRKTNGHRVLLPPSVATMETPPFSKFPTQPLAWDAISGNVLSKNGRIDGGTALVHKYLPGSAHPDDEINVAIAINKWGVLPTGLIEVIAAAAAAAYVADDYDLFDPQYRCYQPPARRFTVTGVGLEGFYPAGTAKPLPAKIVAPCPVNITLKGTFQHIRKGKVEYRFRFLVENKVSTTFSTELTGDPEDPNYVAPTVFHTVPLPLPAAIKQPPQGGIPPGPEGFAVLEPPLDPLFPPGPKGPKGPGQVVAPTVPGIKGTVRLEVLTPSGGLVSNPVHYHIECAQEMAIVSGTVELRDESPKAPACPRPASVAASIRTNQPGPVDYVLACTGQGRNWKGTTTAHQTAPNIFIGVVVHPIQIAQQEDVICFLRRGEQFGFSDVLATGKRLYPCKVTGVTIPDPVPPPAGPPGDLKQPDAPRFVCLGGRTVGRIPHQVCDCPSGHERQQTGPGRFQCVRTVIDLVCAGGRVAGTKSAPSCICPAGQTAKQVAPNRFECAVQLVCEGGQVVTRGQPPRSTCECPRGFVAQKVPPVIPASIRAIPGKVSAAKDDEPDRFRCVRVPVPDKGGKAGSRAPVPVR